MSLTPLEWKLVKAAEYKVFGHTLETANTKKSETITELQNIFFKNELLLDLQSNKESGIKPSKALVGHEELPKDGSYEGVYGGDPKNNEPGKDEIEMEDKHSTDNNLYNNRDHKKSMNKSFNYEKYEPLKSRTIKKTFTSYPDAYQVLKAVMAGWGIDGIDADGAYTETIKRLDNREFGDFDTESEY